MTRSRRVGPLLTTAPASDYAARTRTLRAAKGPSVENSQKLDMFSRHRERRSYLSGQYGYCRYDTR
jgi:hypothetical protein